MKAGASAAAERRSNAVQTTTTSAIGKFFMPTFLVRAAADAIVQLDPERQGRDQPGPAPPRFGVS